MRVLDRYIMRELFFPIIYCALALVMLLLIADVFDNLDEFIRNHTSLQDMGRYYLALIPFLFCQIIPWATFLGTVYVLVTLSHHNETIAMKIAGLNIAKIVLPILYVGFIIGIATFIIVDKVVPYTYLLSQKIKAETIDQHTTVERGEVIGSVTYNTPEYLLFSKEFYPEKQELRDVIVIFLDARKQMDRKIVAREGVWTTAGWELQMVTMYDTDAQGRMIGDPEVRDVHIPRDITVQPAALLKASRESAFLSYKDLNERVRQLRVNNISTDAEQAELQHKLAFPWQSLVMILIAIPLLSNTKTRKGIALNILICLGVVFCYHVVSAVFLALGKSGTIYPFISAWVGNIAFTVGSVIFLEQANY